MDREMQLLLSFQALHHFVKEHQRQPGPYNSQDAEALVKLTQDLNAQTKQVEQVDEALIRLLAFGASGELSPIVIHIP
jgi:ubiquitin-activating enzyme E1